MEKTDNRAEAERWLAIAIRLLNAEDFAASKRFSLRAQEKDPSWDGVDQVMMIADVLLASQKRINNHIDWYSILQLDVKSADLEQIKKQYRRYALVLHPDKNKYPFAENAFKMVSDAWAVLSDPSKKTLYDNELNLLSKFKPIVLADSENTHSHLVEQGPNPTVRKSPREKRKKTEKGAEWQNGSKSEKPPRVSRLSSFWTACPYCYHLYEYPRVFEDCVLRCQNCRRGFHAAVVPSPPPVVPGSDGYYCCWAFFPIGFAMPSDGKEGGVPNWSPFTSMFSTNSQLQGGNSQPQGGNSQPHGGNTQPQGGDLQPQVGNTPPQGGNTQPQGANLETQGVDVQPQGFNLEPQGVDVQPQGFNLEPQGVNLQPEGVIVQPKEVVLQPEEVILQPEGVILQPDGVNLQPEGIILQPEEVNLQPKGVNLKPERVNVQYRLESSSEREEEIVDSSDESWDAKKNGRKSATPKKSPMKGRRGRGPKGGNVGASKIAKPGMRRKTVAKRAKRQGGRSNVEMVDMDLNVEIKADAEEPYVVLPEGVEVESIEKEATEGIGFFEGLDDILGNLPLLKDPAGPKAKEADA